MNEQALKERVKAIAGAENRTFGEVWKRLLLERFLVRLSRSEYADRLIFKGGLLLSHYFDIGRETKDIDVLQGLWSRHISGLGDIASSLGIPDHIEDVVAEINRWVGLNLKIGGNE